MEIKIDKIIRSKRKTFALEITQEAKLVVRAPKYASMETIQKIVYKKRFWIREKQDFMLKKCQKIKQKEFVNGEGFLYLGDIYRLYVINELDVPLKFDGSFQLSRQYIGYAKELLTNWYKAQAYKKILERVIWYSSISRLKYNRVKVTDAQKRWGSCSVKGNLNFSWRLIMAPLKVIDYVVVHELAHLEERNHSARFWNKVGIILPGYEEHKKWLKDNGHLLVF